MASLKDVAKLAGVSLMTVSRAINEPGKLRPETYRRVKQGYRPVGLRAGSVGAAYSR